MIEFVTLLLGLTVGQHPVELVVTSPVTSVELRLDDRPVGRIHAPPWRLELDFGDQLLPRWLEAVGFDESGALVSSVRRAINYTRAQQEATIVLSPDEPGHQRQGRVIWQRSAERQPTLLSLKLDGQTLKIQADGSFTLPERHRSAEVSFLEAEIYFPPIRWNSPTVPAPPQEKFLSNQLSTRQRRQLQQRNFLNESVTIPAKTLRAQLAFGRLLGDGTGTTLTAVPVRSALWPEPPRLDAWFESGGLPLKVFSFSEEGGQLFIVRDPRARKSLKKTLDGLSKEAAKAGNKLPRGVRPGQSVRLLSSFPTVQGQGALFTSIEATEAEVEEGLASLLPHSISQPGRGPEEQHRPWDSVALAGLSASQTNEARVVVLVLSPESRDHSLLHPKQAITYLASLRVPLFIWHSSTEPAETASVGSAKIYRGVGGLRELLTDVERALAEQRIVWVEGEHLPHQIHLTAAAPDSVHLVGPP